MSDKNAKNNNNHIGHRERLKSRFMTDGGLDNFEQHNMLELLLFYSIPRADTNNIAHELIKVFGDLKGVFDAPTEALMQVDGVGKNTATLIKLIPSLSREYLKSATDDIKNITTNEEAIRYISPIFSGIKNEMIVVVCINSTGKLLGSSIISKGTENATEIDTRKLVSAIIDCHAVSAIIAHNHPNGLCVPSKADRQSTSEIAYILNAIGVKLLNHYIISENEFFSFADHPKFACYLNAGTPGTA